MIDPTLEEESCSTASILISAMPNGKVTSVVKLGYGSLLPSTLIKMMKVMTISVYVVYRTLWLKMNYVEFVFEFEFSILQVGKDISLKLNETLMSKLKDENKLGQTKPVFGFLR